MNCFVFQHTFYCHLCHCNLYVISYIRNGWNICVIFRFLGQNIKKKIPGNFSIIISSNTRVDVSFSSVCADYYSLSVDKSHLLIC